MTNPSWNNADDEVYLNEVLFEYFNVGNAVRVCAIDPITNTEVVVVGSAYMSHYSLKMNAMRKLKFMLEKKQAEQQAKVKQAKAAPKEPFRR